MLGWDGYLCQVPSRSSKKYFQSNLPVLTCSLSLPQNIDFWQRLKDLAYENEVRQDILKTNHLNDTEILAIGDGLLSARGWLSR